MPSAPDNSVPRTSSQRDVRDFLDRWEEQVQLHPDKAALVYRGDQYTYAQLDRRATSIAQELRRQGAGRETVVGVCVDRSPDLAASILGILKAGGAYLPLDPRYPRERLAYMAEDARLRFLIAEDKYQGLFPSSELVRLTPAGICDRLDPPALDVRADTSGDRLGYVIYTSGSTGKPKGIALGRRALSNLIDWQLAASTAKVGTRTLQFTPISFDVHFQELFGTWCSGGVLFLIEEEDRLQPDRLLDFLEQNGIERIFLPMVALSSLAEMSQALGKVPATLREVITAGEQLKITPAIRHFFANLPGCTLANHYGPSETHVVTAEVLSGSPSSWPDLPTIGRPITNVAVHLLNEERRPVPNGEVGEIYISGVALAEGYLHQPERTAERFLTLEGMRTYRTGDLGRQLDDGRIEFLGRSDDQVKIRGYRIELGEIEVALCSLPGVRQAAALASDLPSGSKQLVAFVTGSDGAFEIDGQALRQQLHAKLPEYMIPATIQVLARFPLTPSGKIDRKSLPVSKRARPDLPTLFVQPTTPLEVLLAEVWRDLLGIEDVGIHDSFFDLGGNSLAAIQLMTRLLTVHGLELPVARLYETPTIAGLAKSLEKEADPLSPRQASSSMTHREIAIVGIACRFPGAPDQQTFWNNLCQGKESISFFKPEELDPSIRDKCRDPSYVAARGILPDADQFDPSFFGMTQREAEVMDPQQRLFLETSWQALEDAGHMPDTFRGRIGVFGGTHNNSYFRENVQQRPDLTQGLGDLATMVGNEKDYVATRVAHKLNLRGPAISIQTACSTSLVAVTMAVESLMLGRCELALAGGVAVTSPQRSGHTYQEGSILSPDGHCRPFDAAAKGTVFSDGVGIVVLRPLEDALEAGDRIYAVIRGAALNNDGHEKASFSAPSVVGQVEVIRDALDRADTQPTSIGLVEAHGTATPLGDPIEVEALCQAFGSSHRKRQWCALGSVKSNIGHTTAAAGVAGLIKAALALWHSQIPPTLHFETPNAAIDFATSPFFVNDNLRPWPRTEHPRFAAVSSFGVGGTNAHVVLQEAPATSGTASTRPAQLLLLSARSTASLERMAENLGCFMTKNPNVNLADVAYTLGTGRGSFTARMGVVASTIEEAAGALQATNTRQVVRGVVGRGERKIAFLFPGQGAQSTEMARSLYQTEPLFRTTVDECCQQLQPSLGFDLRTLLYPTTSDAESRDRLHETQFAQPALFTIEYALAKLWMSWGIQAAAMIGHSVGEIVAACLAETLPLSDALELVAFRGQQMQQAPPGSMLAVRLAGEAVQMRLSGNLEIAAYNSPKHCVVSGPTEEIANLQLVLEQESIPCTLLKTSHAFHSALMEPAVGPMTEKVRGINLYPPKIRIVSTVTGKMLGAEEATSPDYWGTQIRRPVRFTEAVAELWRSGDYLLLEVGPRATLATLARQQIVDPQRQAAIPSLEEVNGGTEEWASLLRAMAQLWVQGAPLDLHAFYNSERRATLSLPTYPFERRRCWVDPPLQTVAAEQPRQSEVSMDGAQVPQLLRPLAEMLEEITGIDVEAFDADASFLEMGLDSLLLTQVASAIERRFQVKTTFRQLLDGLSTPALLAAHLESLAPASILAQYAPVRTEPAPVAAAVVEPAAHHEPSPPVLGSIACDAGVEAIVAQQLELMRQQLELLRGGSQPQRPSNDAVSAAPSLTLPAVRATPANAPKQSEETSEKKPFGAAARIKLQAQGMSEPQRSAYERIMERYVRRTKRSKELTAANRPFLADPRVVSGFRPELKEVVYPIVVERSKGSKLWDVDGNEYVDLTCGFGSNFFGNSPDFLVEAIEKQLHTGYEIGPQSPLAGEAAKGICELTGQDRAAFCNTGSEAVLGALRLARCATGRDKVAMFTGAYHGIVDEVIVRRGKNGRSFAAASGIPASAVENTLLLGYGSDAALEVLRQQASELAAILVEPVQSRCPELQPREFLHELRAIANASGCALIMDEVITGFRVHAGGAQAHFGVKGDLATYGKVIGGGMPIGVIAGSRRFMDGLDGGAWQFGDDSFPAVGVTYFAGTFVRHPLALAAANAVIAQLKHMGPKLYENLNARAQQFADEINQMFAARQAPLRLDHFGSLMHVRYLEDQPYGELFYTLVRDRGVHLWDARPCFLTTAHTDEDLAKIQTAFLEAVLEMQEHGFLPPGPPMARAEGAVAAKNGMSEEPPVPGARLGRDPKGKPAWYISDPARPGRFIQVGVPL